MSPKIWPSEFSRATAVPGEAKRDANKVIWYLSAAKSHCTPLKVGLEKVRGVRVVRRASPMVMDE